MTKRFLILTACAASLILPYAGALAQTDKAGKQQTAEEAILEKFKETTPPEDIKAYEKMRDEQKKSTSKVNELIQKMYMKLDMQEQQHFFLAYTNYNMLSTVKMVQSDVSRAIEACGKNNPDMKKQLDARYKTWDGAISPVLKEAEDNISNMVMAQDYANQDDMKALFAALDETRTKTNSQIDKIPVTTPQACTYLLNKMDETQGQMTSLLNATLVSYPRSLPAEANKPLEGVTVESMEPQGGPAAADSSMKDGDNKEGAKK